LFGNTSKTRLLYNANACGCTYSWMWKANSHKTASLYATFIFSWGMRPFYENNLYHEYCFHCLNLHKINNKFSDITKTSTQTYRKNKYPISILPCLTHVFFPRFTVKLIKLTNWIIKHCKTKKIKNKVHSYNIHIFHTRAFSIVKVSIFYYWFST